MQLLTIVYYTVVSAIKNAIIKILESTFRHF